MCAKREGNAEGPDVGETSTYPEKTVTLQNTRSCASSSDQNAPASHHLLSSRFANGDGGSNTNSNNNNNNNSNSNSNNKIGTDVGGDDDYDDFPVSVSRALWRDDIGPGDEVSNQDVSDPLHWSKVWRTLRAEEFQLERFCREEVLSVDLREAQARHSPELRRTLEPVFAIPAERARCEAETRRWEDNFFQDVSHMRKRLIAFIQNSRPDSSDSVLALQKALAERLTLDLQVFRGRCAEDLELCLDAEVGERQFLRFEEIERRYDDYLSAPSAALRPPSPVAEQGIESPTEAEPREDPEIAGIRSELDENALLMMDAQKDLSMFPEDHVQVVRRALRIFKLRLSNAFYRRISEQLPQASPQLLCELASVLATEENLKARKRLLLSRWRRRRQELLESGQEEVQMFDQRFEDTAMTASTRTSSPVP
eukprot:CAMPEP_0206602214 /NCGR_PEP_ID=MMETSP0325_2-20121206/47233_1 /ASSEMBLY_ACC=CAM_ASM_000347 /TAXON_ID=2866 /ORGANISM="Crypthecodinium cohnii, Strain Seligo" /LENGTH=424 /DNA_ID=CAMNT_0054114617 /DNA_START=20 /DNA_END=1290 /DNA_ORIENTATION=+